MKGSRIVVWLMVAAACSWVCGCAGTASTAAPEKKTTLRWASPFKPGHTLVETGNKFKEIIEKSSGGRLVVDVQSGVGSEEDINDWCSQGKVEMQATGGRPLEVSAPQYFFFNAPYVMKDFDHFMRVWQGSLGKQAREQVEKNGNQKYLGIVYRGLRQTTSNFDGLPKADQELIVKAVAQATDWANGGIKKEEKKLLIELQRKGMQVVMPDADSLREKGKPAVEQLFKTEWPVTTWAEVLAQ